MAEPANTPQAEPDKDSLPGSHKPIIPLPPGVPADALKAPEPKKPEVPEVPKPKPVKVPKAKPPEPKKTEAPKPPVPEAIKPKDVVLPEEAEPELAAPEEKTLGGPKKDMKSKATIKPVLEAGPPLEKKSGNTLKYVGLGIAGVVVISLILVGYMFLKDRMMTPPETEVVVPETEIETEEGQIAKDQTSMDALKIYFEDIGKQVEELEQDSSFEKTMNLSGNEFD